MAPQQRILVESEGGQFEAVVRHSEPDGIEYVIGAEMALAEGGRFEPATETDLAAEQATITADEAGDRAS
jgi:hypothetical protein